MLCDFHREQDWNRFLRRDANGIRKDEQEPIKAMLQRLARSKTEEEFEESRKRLMESTLWSSNKSLQNYISTVWLAPETVKVYKYFLQYLVIIDVHV